VKNDTPANLKERKRRVAEIAHRLRPFSHRDSSNDAEAGPVDALVATILSQNTSDINSHRAYLQLRATYSSWDEVADTSPEDLAGVIRSGGLADQKSRTIISALRAIRERYGNFELEALSAAGDDELLRDLTAMKGVGLKTAACVLMFSLDRDLCAVDTHIHRVANRLGIVQTTTPEKTFHELRPLIPEGKGKEFHVGMIRFGRQICKAQRPHCFECPLFDLCRWESKEEYARAGLRGPRAASGDLVLLDIINGPSRKK
jgi:endonuclease-3